MSRDRPAAETLTQGMTVRIEQGDQDLASTDREPVVGEIGTVIGEDARGAEVKLKNGSIGHVLEVVAET